MTELKLIKPLGMSNYASIPHLPESRLGPKDYHCHPQQARICTEQVRDSLDTVIVTEKLDGANCGVAYIDGELVAIGRGGYRCLDSEHSHMHAFAWWVAANESRFKQLLHDGERCVGEWMLRAHGTRYLLPHEPFVALDLMVGKEHATWADFTDRCDESGFVIPRLISHGPAISVDAVLDLLEPSGHGAIDPVEGAVWRVERGGRFDFMTKFVRHQKQDGCLLPQVSGQAEILNRCL